MIFYGFILCETPDLLKNHQINSEYVKPSSQCFSAIMDECFVMYNVTNKKMVCVIGWSVAVQFDEPSESLMSTFTMIFSLERFKQCPKIYDFSLWSTN